MSEPVELLPGYVSPRGLGPLPREDFARYSGLELLQRMIDGHYPAPPMAGLLNFTLTEVAEGRAVFRGLPGEKHLNPMGGVHGGWAATVMDSALGCAVHSVLAKGQAYTTVEFKLNLTRPITPRTGEVSCEGRIVHSGRTIAVSEATLRDGAGRVLAFGTETCAIFAMEDMARR